METSLEATSVPHVGATIQGDHVLIDQQGVQQYRGYDPRILLSELSRRCIRSINKLIRVGRTEPVVVIRVDKDKGYIDLSKRRVSKEDIKRCTEHIIAQDHQLIG